MFKGLSKLRSSKWIFRPFTFIFIAYYLIISIYMDKYLFGNSSFDECFHRMFECAETQVNKVPLEGIGDATHMTYTDESNNESGETDGYERKAGYRL